MYFSTKLIIYTNYVIRYHYSNNKVIFHNDTTYISNPFRQNEFAEKNGNEEKIEHRASFSKIFNTYDRTGCLHIIIVIT